MAVIGASETTRTRELHKGGTVVGLLDRTYVIDGESEIRFERIQVLGDLSGELEYYGRRLIIESVEDFVGLEITRRGVEGPLWVGVVCRVLAD